MGIILWLMVSYVFVKVVNGIEVYVVYYDVIE